jgi:hypothetical protein
MHHDSARNRTAGGSSPAGLSAPRANASQASSAAAREDNEPQVGEPRWRRSPSAIALASRAMSAVVLGAGSTRTAVHLVFAIHESRSLFRHQPDLIREFAGQPSRSRRPRVPAPGCR